jgi:hypothetical protein
VTDAAVKVIEKVAAAVPEFADVWEAHRASVYHQPGHSYTDLSQLARFVVELGRAGSDDMLVRIFDIVEQALRQADASLGEEIIIGLLEDIQNIGLNTDVPSDTFEPFLGPSTLRGWRIIEQYWNEELEKGELQRFIEEERWRVPTG